MKSNSLDLGAYTYDLPEEKIAKHPLANRSASKLLHYRKGTIQHAQFDEIPKLLPENAHLVFNDTKVIPARIVFHKDTGARIEVFLLEPMAPSHIYETAMASHWTCSWHVMIGNAKKWKVNTTLQLDLGGVVLEAQRTGEATVTFHWNEAFTFSEVLGKAGTIPLPPYLGREASEEDVPRYQTVYSRSEGAVAAPTAGLHFTDTVLDEIGKKAISTDYLTLHVSAGTFQPIKAKSVTDHPMHREQIVVTRVNIEHLLKKELVIPVGTTSMRTLESIYWFGARLEDNPDSPFFVEKLDPYSLKQVSRNVALENVLQYMDRHKTKTIIGHTEIFIIPGYTFQLCKGLVTNFHLPGSTLILLVAALIGNDWRMVYNTALENNYRFLSYGDSSLLIP